MPYKPWCPKCGETLYLDETQWPPTVRCRCGYNLVDTNHMRGLVNSQQKEYETRERAREEAARKRLKEAQEAEREAARLEAERKRAEAEEQRRLEEEQRKIRELPQPTAAQRKQGYTCPVYCAECGAIVWRRKCEIGKREHFFCSREHQAEWRKRNPVGVIQQRARSTG